MVAKIYFEPNVEKIFHEDSYAYRPNRSAIQAVGVLRERCWRKDLKQWNQMLLEVAHNSRVITNQEYAEFQNAGYMGLYGGLTVDDIDRKKNN